MRFRSFYSAFILHPSAFRSAGRGRKLIWRVTLSLLCVVLLAGGTILILFSRRHLAGSDDAELAGWCVMLGLGLSAAAAFLVETILFPKIQTSVGPLQFVILHHEGIDDPHFDVMLETSPGSELATWRAPVWPITEPTTLVQLANHRRDYIEYEGEISGDRGRVRRIMGGTCQVRDEPGGGKLIQWNPTGASAAALPPLVLRRIEQNRWSASAK
jgi:hypothetical protein